VTTSGHRALGRYVLGQEIASGGMATVHLGRLAGDAGVARAVAIKRLHPQFAKDPEFVSMFVDEARIATRVHHPNVAAVLDLVALEGELFLVMEYLHGESLSRLASRVASRSGRIPPPIVASIVAGALHGLHAAHTSKNERGEPLSIVHRDVSPQNILVGVDGAARVLDFGVAKAVGRLQTTREGQLKGKLGYMAPEQILGYAVDARTDVYAVGVIAWEALAGARLHQGDNEGLVLAQVLAGASAPPSLYAPDIDPAWDDIVMRALSVEPSERYESARAMAEAIEASVTCAPAREVGAWVAEVAAEELEKRAALLSAFERGGGPSAPVGLESIVAAASAPAERAAQGARPEAPREARAYARWALAAVALTGIAAVAARVAPGLLSERPSDGRRARALGALAQATELRAAVSSSAAALATADAVGAPTASPSATSAMSAPTETPKASAPPPRAAESVRAGRALTGSSRAPAAPAKTQAVPSATAKPGCSDPFVTDANGVVRVRRECL
jgi:hypothetical protein